MGRRGTDDCGRGASVAGRCALRGWKGAQSVALGWYPVSRWDTGRREGRRGSGRGRREVVEPGRLGYVRWWGDSGPRMDEMDGMDGMDEMVSGVKAAQSVALGGYGAFLLNAGVRGVGVPRALLWAGIRCPVGTRGGGRCGEDRGGEGVRWSNRGGWGCVSGWWDLGSRMDGNGPY